MYPTDDQSNGRVGMPVSDQRRSLTPPTRDSAASRNAAADVIRGQLDAIYSRTEEQNSAPEKTQTQPFSAQLQSKPEVRPEHPKTQIVKPQQASTTPQPEPKKDTVNHAMRTAPIAQTQIQPNSKFSYSHSSFSRPMEAIPQRLAEILSDVLRALLRWRHCGKKP